MKKKRQSIKREKYIYLEKEQEKLNTDENGTQERVRHRENVIKSIMAVRRLKTVAGGGAVGGGGCHRGLTLSVCPSVCLSVTHCDETYQ